MTTDFPTPQHIKGGCLCGALRYEVDFPPNHDFKTASSTCQCTQCRKQTSTLFLLTHSVRPASKCFRFTSPSTETLKNFEASPRAQRGFCTACGSLLYWKSKDQDRDELSFTVGTVDPLYLIGDGADGDATGKEAVPKGGYGLALASGEGNHWWCENEVLGVTDREGFLKLGFKGKRWERED